MLQIYAYSEDLLAERHSAHNRKLMRVFMPILRQKVVVICRHVPVYCTLSELPEVAYVLALSVRTELYTKLYYTLYIIRYPHENDGHILNA